MIVDYGNWKRGNKMKERIAKLIDLKSIVTLIMVAALVAGWFMGKVTSEQFVPLVIMILTFYFAKTKVESNAEAEKTNPTNPPVVMEDEKKIEA